MAATLNSTEIHVFYNCLFLIVAEGVTAVNQAVDANNEKLLMAALTYPRVSIYGVTSQCSQQYLEELTKLKDAKKQPGWC